MWRWMLLPGLKFSWLVWKPPWKLSLYWPFWLPMVLCLSVELLLPQTEESKVKLYQYFVNHWFIFSPRFVNVFYSYEPCSRGQPPVSSHTPTSGDPIVNQASSTLWSNLTEYPEKNLHLHICIYSYIFLGNNTKFMCSIFQNSLNFCL